MVFFRQFILFVMFLLGERLMMKRLYFALCILPVFAVTGCGAHANVLSQLPAEQQTKVTQALNSGGNMHLPSWLPFTPTHASVTTRASMGNSHPTNYVTISLYNQSELLVIESPFEALDVHNVPNSLHLNNGVPASFTRTATHSILSFANGPTQEYTLYSGKIQNGDPHAVYRPDLSLSQLKKIADSIPAE